MSPRAGPSRRSASSCCASSAAPASSATRMSFLLSLDLGNEPVDDEGRERLLEVGRWSQAHLGDEGIEFLRGFRPTVELDLGGAKLLCCHATPSSNEDVIVPDTPRTDAERMIGEPDADAVAAGHVHLQWLRRFSSLVWLCVGSVGLGYEHKDPMDEAPFEPWSEYALLSGVDGGLAVEFQRVPFDVEELVDAARAADFPDVERWAGSWKR